MKKRLISTIAAATLMLSTSTSMATQVYASTPTEYVIVEDDMLASVTMAISNEKQIITISQIQNLMEQRTTALLNDDMKSYNQIDDTLQRYGVKSVSKKELNSLLTSIGQPGIPYDSSTTLAEEPTKFEYVYTDYEYNGQMYDILRVLASPNGNYRGDSALYQTGSYDVSSLYPAELMTIDLIELGVSYLSGITKYGEVAGTLLDVVNIVSSGLNRYSLISNIESTYDYVCAEGCSWIYVSERNEDNYRLSGRYHRGEITVDIDIFKLINDGMDFHTQYSFRGIHSKIHSR